MKGPDSATPSAHGSAARRPRPLFLAAVEPEVLADDLQRMLEELLGPVDFERLPEDGPVALARLKASRPRLAFLSTRLRLIEATTVLRAIPPARAGQVVLVVPDTLEGYRAAWDGLYFGARDFVVTRGLPAQRFKGGTAVRGRQLAHLLTDGTETDGAGAVPGFDGAWRVESACGVVALPGEAAGGWSADGSSEQARGSDGVQVELPEKSPWVILAESRHLPAVAAWLRFVPPAAPVLLRVPEGPRLQRVVREGLSRLLCHPVRIVRDGDRLVPGHVHLAHDAEAPVIVEAGGFLRVHLVPVAEAPGSWGAQRSALRRLGSSPVPLRLILPGASCVELEEFAAFAGDRHACFRLRRGEAGRGSAEPEAEVVAPRSAELPRPGGRRVA